MKTLMRTVREWSCMRAPGRARLCPTISAAARAALSAGFIAAAIAPAAAAGVSVENPWLRFIIASRPAAGYFTLHNDTGTAIELTGASSTACGMLMLHQTKEVNGVEKMLPVKSVAVPAHGTVSFAPGGYHLMCVSPGAAVAQGRSVPIVLKFSDGKTVTADFPVKGPGNAGK